MPCVRRKYSLLLTLAQPRALTVLMLTGVWARNPRRQGQCREIHDHGVRERCRQVDYSGRRQHKSLFHPRLLLQDRLPARRLPGQQPPFLLMVCGCGRSAPWAKRRGSWLPR